MPTYQITAPDGRKLKITGETFPSEQELDEIFSGLDNNIAPETSNVSGVDFNQLSANVEANMGENETSKLNDNLQDFNLLAYDASSFSADRGMDNNSLAKLNFYVDQAISQNKKPNALDKVMGWGLNVGGEILKSGQALKDKYEDKTIEEVIEAGDIANSTKQVAKSFGRGGLAFTKGLGSVLQVIGDNLAVRPQEKENMNAAEQLFWNELSSSVTGVAGIVKKYSQLGMESKLLKLDEKLFAGSFVENPSFTRALSIIGGALPPLMGGGIVYKVTKSPVLTYSILAGAESGEVYEEAKEKNLSMDSATGLFLASAGGTAAIDLAFKPIEKILDVKIKATSGRVRKALVDGTREGTTESFQQVWQNMVRKYGIDETQELTEGIIESLIGGVGSAGALSFATSGGKNRYDNAVEVMKEKGATNSSVEAFSEIIAQEISEKRESIEPIFKENIDKSIASFDKWLNDHGDLESKKAIRESLDQVYSMSYDNLLGKMDKTQARNNAKLMQGIALAGSKMTGLTPMEYISQRAPEVRSAMEDAIVAKNELAASLDKIRNPWKIKKVKDERQSLLQFLKFQGGLKDSGGELKAMDAGKSIIGLVNNQNGLNLDDAAMMAWEKGYFEGKSERPEINNLLDAMADELAGNKHYNEEFKGNEEAAYLADLAREIQRAGLSTQDDASVIYEALYKNSKPEISDFHSQEDILEEETLGFDQSSPQIEIKGDELGEYTDLADLREKAFKYMERNLRGRRTYNFEIGADIEIRKTAVKKYFSFTADVQKLKAVPYLLDILSKGKIVKKSPSYTRDTERNIKSYYELEAKVRIDGESKVLSTIIKEDDKGNFFWDLQVDKKNPSGYIGNNTERDGFDKEPRSTSVTIPRVDALMKEPQTDSATNPRVGVLNKTKTSYNQDITQENDNINLKIVDKTSDSRGHIDFLDDGRAIISLLENADVSTFIHEIGHFWLNEINELAGVSNEAAKMVVEINKWLGATGDGVYTKTQHEQFARGLEQFMREGKAPSHYLKSVFKRFMEWLRDLYRTADELEVKLSDDVRGVYGQLFGGKDLDFFMKNDIPIEDIIKSNIEQRKRRVNDYQEAVTRGIERMQKKKSLSERIKKGSLETLQNTHEYLQDVFMVSEDVLGQYSKELVLKNRRLAIAKMSNTRDYNVKILPFLEAWQKMPDQDKFRLDMALKNHFVEDVNALITQYGINKEWQQVTEILDEIHNQMLDVGIDVKYMQDYFPRGIKDADGLLDAIEKRIQKDPDAKYSMIERALKEKARSGRQYSKDDMVQLVNTLMRGYGGSVTLANIGNVKARTLELIDEELNEFYSSSPEALINYISSSVEMVENKRYFGKESADVQLIRNRVRNRATKIKDFSAMEPKEVKIREIKRLNYEIGGIEAKIRNTFDVERKKELGERKKKLEEQVEFFVNRNAGYVKNITLDRMRKELELVQEELNTKVDDTIEGSIGRLILNMIGQGKIKAHEERRIREYLTAKFTPAQMSKFVQGMHNMGYIATIGKFTSMITQFGDLALSAYQNGWLNSGIALGQAIKGKSEINLEMVGIDNKKIAEFAENTGFLAESLDKVLGYSGFTKIDNLGKRVVMNSALIKLRKDIKKGNKETLKYLQAMFGDGAAQVKNDLLAGRVTPEIMEVAVFKVMDLQPLTADQTPMFYMKGGNLRILYALKTYTLRLLNVYKRDCIDKLFIEGKPIEATANFLKLAIYLGLANSGVDLLKDLLLGREIKISDTLIENILGLSLVKKYQIESFKRDGFEAFFNIMPPTIQMAGDIANDLFNGNKDISNRKSWRYLPFGGDFYYYWFGGGNAENKSYERKKAGRRATESRRNNILRRE